MPGFQDGSLASHVPAQGALGQHPLPASATVRAKCQAGLGLLGAWGERQPCTASSPPPQPPGLSAVSGLVQCLVLLKPTPGSEADSEGWQANVPGLWLKWLLASPALARLSLYF